MYYVLGCGVYVDGGWRSISAARQKRYRRVGVGVGGSELKIGQIIVTSYVNDPLLLYIRLLGLQTSNYLYFQCITLTEDIEDKRRAVSTKFACYMIWINIKMIE